jgi:hypothetical protein
MIPDLVYDELYASIGFYNSDNGLSEKPKDPVIPWVTAFSVAPYTINLASGSFPVL